MYSHLTIGISDLARAMRFYDAAYAAALANGGRDEGAPGLRAHYAPDYYGAYVRDPDGNKLHFVCCPSERSSPDFGS